MKLKIIFKTPDNQLIAQDNTISVNDMLLGTLNPNALENLVRGIALGYGIQHGFETDKISVLELPNADWEIRAEATVVFRKITYGAVTLNLAEIVRKLATRLHEHSDAIKLRPAEFQANYSLCKDAWKMLKELGL